MPTGSTNLDDVIEVTKGNETKRRTMRFQVASLVVCTVLSAGCGLAAITLPWFGLPQPGGFPFPSFIATSSALSVPPFGSGHLAPGTQGWGYLIVVWSASVVGLAVAAIVACVRSTRQRRAPDPAVLCVVAGALVLIALVIPEIMATIPYGDGPPLSYDFGALIGLVLAALSFIAALASWATTRYPWLVHDPMIDADY